MSFEKATRRDVPLLIGIAGASGSGKTYSALRLAKGIAGGRPIAFIDTERGRSLHYADDFDFLHTELDAPFSPQAYGEKLAEARTLDPAVIVIDSFTHEWAGEGGVLDMQQAEYERMGAREAVKFASWIKPKGEHKALVNDVLLRLPCHLIVCLRAEEKVEMVKGEKGKLEVVPKRTLAGHVGWIPVCGKDLPYELTVSLVVTPDKPGVPVPIKLQEQHRPLVPLDQPLSEDVGRALAEWAAGSGAVSSAPAAAGATQAPAAPVSPEPPPSPDRTPNGGSGVLTDQQRDRLDDLTRAYSLPQLIAAFAKERGVEADAITIDGWPELREQLTEDEAAGWIERMEARAA